MIKEVYQFFVDLYGSIGFSSVLATFLINLMYLLFIALVAWLSDFLGRSVIHAIIRKITDRTSWEWDNIMVQRKVFRRVANLLPAIVIYALFPKFFADYPFWVNIVIIVMKIYMVIVTVLIINSLLNTLNDIYQSYDIARNKPIQGYIQVVQILMYLFALVFIIALLINRNPLYLLTGLGAFMAILVLVFKDPIQGFVASIQLSANDMVRIGDWITMQKFGADGDVLEITLATVKIKNFDNTIVSIPTYSLITDSFQNWRGMQESDGRRIKRPIFIDMNSARFADDALLNKLKKFSLIKDYIDEKQAEIDRHNAETSTTIDRPTQFYGRRQTNLGIFRAYVEAYLRNHPQVNTEMMLMVRQLQPTEMGIPLEVYAFSKIKDWVYYERLQADIFDHLISIVPEFELRIFQEPSGRDFAEGIRAIS
ncbi:MAG: mechanosensitive ion channel family protein [Bacteroidales bacterium]